MKLSVFEKTLLISFGLLLGLVGVSLLSLVVGTSTVDVKRFLLEGIGGDEARKTWTILMGYRLPRTLLAAAAGGGLATAGVVFQGVLRNPLADPCILGIAAGGALGAAISIVSYGQTWYFGTPLSAFLGSVLAMSVVYGLATIKRGAGYVNTVILAGVIVAAFMNALLLLLLSYSQSHELQRILFWLIGDLSMADFRKAAAAGVFVLLGWTMIYLNANRLNLLIIGDEAAANLGLNVSLARTFLLLVASMITGIVVSVAGTIGFVGLVVPHAMRLLFGPDNRVLLPAALLGGASFLAAADCAARVVAYPVELPVGIITALAGAPFFLYLLVRR
jgi:iron complex transport system permease protein